MAKKLRIRISTRNSLNVSASQRSYDLFLNYPTKDENIFVPAFDRRIIADFAKEIAHYCNSKTKSIVLYDVDKHCFQKAPNQNTVISGLNEASYPEVEKFVLKIMSTLRTINSSALIELSINNHRIYADVSQRRFVKSILKDLL